MTARCGHASPTVPSMVVAPSHSNAARPSSSATPPQPRRSKKIKAGASARAAAASAAEELMARLVATRLSEERRANKDSAGNAPPSGVCERSRLARAEPVTAATQRNAEAASPPSGVAERFSAPNALHAPATLGAVQSRASNEFPDKSTAPRRGA